MCLAFGLPSAVLKNNKVHVGSLASFSTCTSCACSHAARQQPAASKLPPTFVGCVNVAAVHYHHCCCMQAGRDIFDLGEVLYAFLLRYGEDFDYESMAVSVASGGIVPKHVSGRGHEVPLQLVHSTSARGRHIHDW